MLIVKKVRCENKENPICFELGMVYRDSLLCIFDLLGAADCGYSG